MSQSTFELIDPPAEYHSFGALISRSQFLKWTGLSGYDFDLLKASREIREYRPPGSTRSKYYKADAARIACWKV